MDRRAVIDENWYHDCENDELESEHMVAGQLGSYCNYLGER